MIALGRGGTRCRSVGARHSTLMPVELIVVGFRASLVVAVRLLQKHQIKRLVVLDADNEMVGIVSRRDLLAGLSVVPKPPPIHRTASTPPARVA